MKVAAALSARSAPSLARREAERIARQLMDSWAPPTPPKRKTVDPIFPNVGVQQWYQQALLELLDTATIELHSILANTELPKYGFAHDASTTTDQLTRILANWGKRMIARFDKMSNEIAKAFATRSKHAAELQMRAAFKRSGWTVKFQPTAKSLAAYKGVIAENVGLIRSIAQKYHTDVQERVWSAVRKGGDLRELSIGLRKTYGISARRAAFISRDQTAKAKAIIEATRDQELGVTHAIWHHSHAGKVPRPTHLAMNGKEFALKEGMYDSAEGRNVWPGELINCRCSWSPIIEGFEI